MTWVELLSRLGLVLGVLVVLAGCANPPADRTATSACIAAIAADERSDKAELDAEKIRVVNWNIQKGIHPDWVDDLNAIQNQADLLILQEASPEFDAWNKLVPIHYRSFAQGFSTFGLKTGVMTLSAAAPVVECDLVEHEPWLRTPKAMLVTEYGIAGRDSTLLVINIHGVNFSVGMRQLHQQLAAAKRVIAVHQGPVIFSGDFNTWRGARTDLLQETVNELGLEAVAYRTDHRKRFLGWPLDHIYVRDLNVINSATHPLDSSDHNPMTVELQLPYPAENTSSAR